MKRHKSNSKTKLRIHMKKNIPSFNKCKLDTMWPINSCMSRENIMKKWNFEKQSKLMQKLLKAHYFMNKMHEYEMKGFSKTLEFNLHRPKTSFSIKLSSKTQTLSTFCIKIKKLLILDGHNKITHKIMYQV